MTRASERRLEDLESRYRALLVHALRQCAHGKWGLFGQNDHVVARMTPHEGKRHRHPEVEEILDLGDQITRMRQRLGIAEPFEPHQRLMAIRLAHDANTPGEPRLAQQWLKEIDR